MKMENTKRTIKKTLIYEDYHIALIEYEVSSGYFWEFSIDSFENGVVYESTDEFGNPASAIASAFQMISDGFPEVLDNFALELSVLRKELSVILDKRAEAWDEFAVFSSDQTSNEIDKWHEASIITRNKIARLEAKVQIDKRK